MSQAVRRGSATGPTASAEGRARQRRTGRRLPAVPQSASAKRRRSRPEAVAAQQRAGVRLSGASASRRLRVKSKLSTSPSTAARAALRKPSSMARRHPVAAAESSSSRSSRFEAEVPPAGPEPAKGLVRLWQTSTARRPSRRSSRVIERGKKRPAAAGPSPGASLPASCRPPNANPAPAEPRPGRRGRTARPPPPRLPRAPQRPSGAPAGRCAGASRQARQDLYRGKQAT